MSKGKLSGGLAECRPFFCAVHVGRWNEKTCRTNQSNMIRMLQEENKVLQERLKTHHTIVIPAEGDN